MGRLVASLGRCGRAMAALPPQEEAVLTGQMDIDAVEAKPEAALHTEDAAKEAKHVPVQGKAGAAGADGSGGGAKKKKKGKR